jgi:hypothetical protein
MPERPASGPPDPEPSGEDAWGTSRRSRLFPGPFLAHADLHNHTWLSDGRGDPALTFPALRSAGLDVAAITDHARWASVLFGRGRPPGAIGIDAHAWARTRELADQADDPGGFVALGGFEWSHALHGHMSVWGSRRFTDALRTFGPPMSAFWTGWRGPARTASPGSTIPARPARGASAASGTARRWPGGWSAWRSSTRPTTTCSRAPTGGPRRRWWSAWTPAGGPACWGSPTSTAPTGGSPRARAAPACTCTS